jgi:fatty-acyl-CoA synthase
MENLAKPQETSHASADWSPPWVDGHTIGDILRETARRHPTNDAVIFCDPPTRWTWSEFDREVDRVAKALLAAGFERGQHFGVWATNVPEWVLLQFATARIGVVLVTINPSYRAGELRYALQQSDVRGLALIDSYRKSDYHQILKDCCPKVADCQPGQLESEHFPLLRWVVGLRGACDGAITSWKEFIALADAVSDSQLADAMIGLSPLDPINIQYTSGTTGPPKGATLSHRNVLLNGHYCGTGQRLTSEDRLCLPVPLYHCFGCVLGTMCCIVHGTTMVFPGEGFDPAKTMSAIEAERCTGVYGVPTMYIAQFEHADYRPERLATLRTGMMAGSPCPIELMKRVVSEVGASEITIGYGQTETSPLITQTRADDPIELRVGTVGRCIPGVEARVIDPETGRVLGDGEIGELCSRGHNVMLGYYKMPEKTAETIDADGWLRTGDLALREPNGYYRITGRLRDMIIRGGENIYPREIEERLYAHPAVADVQVVGVPDRKFGEEVLAWVKLREGQTATPDELKQFCRSGLAHFKVPHYWKFVTNFPVTATGKIQKFKIREQGIIDQGLEEISRIETA